MTDCTIDGSFDTLVPSFEELTEVFQSGLASNFENVSVTTKECPDLREKPFGLAMKGLNGNPVIADIGGPTNISPDLKKDKLFNINQVLEMVGRPKGTAIGPGAGPWPLVGVNCEMMANCALDSSRPIQSYYAKIDEKDGETPLLLHAKDIGCSPNFALMANLFISDGLPGKVIHVKASKRTGKLNFISCLKEALSLKYGDQAVSVGGVFVIHRGKAKLHVMPDFSPHRLETNAQVGEWLKFFDMNAPLVCLSVFHSHDPGLKLREEHTHCFSDHGQGGHYHYDVTPEQIEYEGYFMPANKVYRIDEC